MSSVPDTIRNAAGERLDFTFHEGRADSGIVVVLGHGVTGNKDRPFATALGAALAAAGVHALRFSFAGNGESEGRFVDSTISKEVDDLGAVIDALDGAGFGPIGYVGHSMGAAVGVLRSARDPRIRSLVSLAGMVHTEDFAERKFGEVEPDRGHMWDREDCPLSQTFMDDMRTIHSVVEHGSSIDVPWRLVHGTADTVVPLQDSRDIVARADDPERVRLIVLEGADHVFSDAAMPRMVAPVVTWTTGRGA